MTDLAELAGSLAARLRAAGVSAGPERAGRFAAALALAPPGTIAESYWLARVTLVGDRGELAAFEAVFAEVFAGLVDPAAFRGDRPPPATAARGATRPPAGGPIRRGGLPTPGGALAEEGGDEGSGLPAEEMVLAARSPEERLRRKDFAALSEDELERLRRLTTQMALSPPLRRSRRRRTGRRGQGVDLRATLRRARRSGGEPIAPQRRRRRDRRRRVVLLCDISGSMEPYARAYLQLLHSGVVGARAEAFVFATRLTRLTPVLGRVAPKVALERAGRLAPDWSGGTRLGVAVKAFNDRYGRRGMARGAVVLVLSDGWDTGDPALLGREMARLQRLAFRVIWVNPRKAAPGFAPLAGGMAAALAHVDVFLSGHHQAALEEVLAAIASPGGP